MEPDSEQLRRLTLRFAAIIRQTLTDMIGGQYHLRDEDLQLEPFSQAKGLIAVIHFGGTIQGDCIMVFRQQDLRKLCEAFCRKNAISTTDAGKMCAMEIISEMMNTSTGQLIPYLDREIDSISIMPPMIVSGTMTFPKVASASIKISGSTGPITCIFALNMMRQKIAETLKIVSEDLEEKTRMALTDSLTGLYNRTHFDQQFHQFADSSLRTHSAFSLMILDIDCLKRINDNFGHQIGDTIINDAAQTIKNGIRQNDIPCRYGGDEFIVMLPGTIDVDAQRVAERIRRRLSDLPQAEGKIAGNQRITLSIGIGQLQADESPQELFRRTDLALYKAKNGGRDRIVLAATGDG